MAARPTGRPGRGRLRARRCASASRARGRNRGSPCRLGRVVGAVDVSGDPPSAAARRWDEVRSGSWRSPFRWRRGDVEVPERGDPEPVGLREPPAVARGSARLAVDVDRAERRLLRIGVASGMPYTAAVDEYEPVDVRITHRFQERDPRRRSRGSRAPLAHGLADQRSGAAVQDGVDDRSRSACAISSRPCTSRRAAPRRRAPPCRGGREVVEAVT